MPRRISILAFGVVSYAIFVGTFVYMAHFIVGFGAGVGWPRILDAAATRPLWQALGINVALVALFGAQHSLMARQRFKGWWTRIVPAELERSIYVLATSLCLLTLFWFWQPMGGVIWHVESALGRGALYAVAAFGWVLTGASTFLIDHFDLFGLRQVWSAFRGRPYGQAPFVQPLPYRIVRHPLYLGFLLALWATPRMTAAHLALAGLLSVYLAIGVRFEERSLIAEHGEAYCEYQRRVPMIVPGAKLGKAGRSVSGG